MRGRGQAFPQRGINAPIAEGPAQSFQHQAGPHSKHPKNNPKKFPVMNQHGGAPQTQQNVTAFQQAS